MISVKTVFVVDDGSTRKLIPLRKFKKTTATTTNINIFKPTHDLPSGGKFNNGEQCIYMYCAHCDKPFIIMMNAFPCAAHPPGVWPLIDEHGEAENVEARWAYRLFVPRRFLRVCAKIKHKHDATSKHTVHIRCRSQNIETWPIAQLVDNYCSR